MVYNIILQRIKNGVKDPMHYSKRMERAMEMAGTIELKTGRLTLRRHIPEDARILYERFGRDEKMYEYSGWNPYATREMAEETIRGFVESYSDERFYGWAIELDGELVGTIGAYDCVDISGNGKANADETAIDHKDLTAHQNKNAGSSKDASSSSIEVGISVIRSKWGQGIAGEALECVLKYLGEEIGTVRAWCAAGNIGSQRIMEKCGMKLIGTEKESLEIGEKKYDKLNYEYSNNGSC